MRDTEIATFLTPTIAGLSSMGLGGVRDAALPLSVINRVCCFQTMDAMFQMNHFKDYFLFKTNKHELIDPKGPEI